MTDETPWERAAKRGDETPVEIPKPQPVDKPKRDAMTGVRKMQRAMQELNNAVNPDTVIVKRKTMRRLLGVNQRFYGWFLFFNVWFAFDNLTAIIQGHGHFWEWFFMIAWTALLAVTVPDYRKARRESREFRETERKK